MEIFLPKPSLSVLIKTNCLDTFILECLILKVQCSMLKVLFQAIHYLYFSKSLSYTAYMYLKQFNHFIEKNLSCRVGFVMLKKGFEVEFCGNVILYFFSGKSGPNVHYQSTQWVVVIIMSSSNQIQINIQIYQLLILTFSKIIWLRYFESF